MQNLTLASAELFRRAPDECFATFDELWRDCQEAKAHSIERWHPPTDLQLEAGAGGLGLTLGEAGTVGLNDWSFTQLCSLAGVSKDTVNRLSSSTASKVFKETLPGGTKPLQVMTKENNADPLVRAIHGVSYTRLFDVDLLSMVREFATDFQPPQEAAIAPGGQAFVAPGISNCVRSTMPSVWVLRARLYDVCEASSIRRGPAKEALFREMKGRVLFVAIGTGVDIPHFPPGQEIVAVDISKEMLRRAEARRASYAGNLQLVEADATSLRFPDASFDTIATSCTFCSVPDSGPALRQLYRVLRPGGAILMFEHVRSRSSVFGLMLDLMTLWTRIGGTEMNRDTLGNVRKAGFEMTRVESAYLDIIPAIYGVKPRNSGRHGAGCDVRNAAGVLGQT